MKKNNINFANVSINNLSAEGGCTISIKGVKAKRIHTKEVDGVKIYTHESSFTIGQIDLGIKGKVSGKAAIKAAKDIATGNVSLDVNGFADGPLSEIGSVGCELSISDVFVDITKTDLDCRTCHTSDDKNEKFESLQATHNTAEVIYFDGLELSGNLQSVCEGLIQVKGQIESMIEKKEQVDEKLPVEIQR